MKRLLGLLAAFALFVLGVESLQVLSAWWDAGRPTPGVEIWIAGAALVVVAYAWWRHSIFNCERGQCLLPEEERNPASGSGKN
jgi:hypothetical protein